MTLDLDKLRELVAVMRELGVTELEGIKLGPVPRAPAEPPRELTAEEARQRAEAIEEERLSIMFGATGVRPRR